MKLSQYAKEVGDLKELAKVLLAQLTKVQGELSKEIGDLQTTITNLMEQLKDVDIPAEAEQSLVDLKDGMANVAGKIQAIDDYNPDAPIPE